MLSYFIIGIAWLFILETITLRDPNIEWSFRARLIHILGWPVSLLIFLTEFFRNL